jgi:ion channel-forming bestrophin family protein
MVKYDPKTWLGLLFHSYNRHIMRQLFPNMLLIGMYSFLVTYFVLDFLGIHFKSITAFHSLLGIILGLFLVFRTNSAYDRWWEGRKLWGALVNNSRNLALKIKAILPSEDRHTKQFYGRMIPNYVFAMKEHLRDKYVPEEIEFESETEKEELEKVEHKPNLMAGKMFETANQLYRDKKITGDQLFIIDKELKSFTDIIGGCERIKNTPIPYSYSMYIKKFIFAFIITLPLGFVHDYEYWTVPLVMLLFYFLVGIELIAEEIEDPFGKDQNDLPLDELSIKIKRNVKEIMSFPEHQKLQES